MSQLSLFALEVIANPFYLEAILANRLSLNQIKPVTLEQSKALNLPGVIYLQIKAKINFSEAKTIYQEALPFFKNESCLYLLMHDFISFETREN